MKPVLSLFKISTFCLIAVLSILSCKEDIDSVTNINQISLQGAVFIPLEDSLLNNLRTIENLDKARYKITEGGLLLLTKLNNVILNLNGVEYITDKEGTCTLDLGNLQVGDNVTLNLAYQRPDTTTNIDYIPKQPNSKIAHEGFEHGSVEFVIMSENGKILLRNTTHASVILENNDKMDKAIETPEGGRVSGINTPHPGRCLDYNGWYTDGVNWSHTGKNWRQSYNNLIGSDCDFALGRGFCYLDHAIGGCELSSYYINRLFGKVLCSRLLNPKHPTYYHIHYFGTSRVY